MLAACTCKTYVRYKFPACSDLIFQTDVVSTALTLVLYHASFGEIAITKTTDSQGRFTLNLQADLEKPHLLNPWIGYFNLWFVYEGDIYDLFVTDDGEVTGVEIEAAHYILPPATYTFNQFFIRIAGNSTEPPDEENNQFTYTLPFLLA